MFLFVVRVVSAHLFESAVFAESVHARAASSPVALVFALVAFVLAVILFAFAAVFVRVFAVVAAELLVAKNRFVTVVWAVPGPVALFATFETACVAAVKAVRSFAERLVRRSDP